MRAGFEITALCKSFPLAGGTVTVLDGLDFTQRPGVTAILGASGCGKTTLLRLIAGMDTADSGTIRHHGTGQIGMVFQEPRLMPWLTTLQNIYLGQRHGRSDPQNLLERTGLAGFGDAYPHQLSGGMQHRAALARALANDPALVLMDEPFAALDHLTRERMQDHLRELQRAEQMNILLVTHSIDEALYLGDRVVIVQHGRIGADLDIQHPPDRDPCAPERHAPEPRDPDLRDPDLPDPGRRDLDPALKNLIRSMIQKDT